MIKPLDLVLVACLLILVALLWLFMPGQEGAVAVVEIEGVCVERILLTSLQDEVIKTYTSAEGTLTLKLSPRGACAVSADCQDHTCIRTGWITKAGQSIVCLPGRICVYLEGGEIHGVTG